MVSEESCVKLFISNKITGDDIVEELLKQILLRLDSLDNTLAGHKARFDSIDARFDGIDARFDGIDSRLDGADARFDGIGARLERLESKTDAIMEQTASLTEWRFDVTRQLDNISDHYQSLYSMFGKQEVEIESLKRRVVSMK